MDEEKEPQTIWGIPVVESDSMPEGTALLADLTTVDAIDLAKSIDGAIVITNLASQLPESRTMPAVRDTAVEFSRYPDGTLRLFKPESILSETPAGYSEERVAVKAIVKSGGEKFVVILPVLRSWLDTRGAEAALTRIALQWRS